MYFFRFDINRASILLQIPGSIAVFGAKNND
jgi:hypothetical protein